MPWFSGALQEVRQRGTGLKESVRHHARNIAARTQQFEDAVAGNLHGIHTAQEVEARLEADARKLKYPAQAAEVLQRWVMLARTAPQPRYADVPVPNGDPSSGNPAELTFRQALLRSRALEYAIDSSARVPELRTALRDYALPSPHEWPDERPPPVAFAHAFVTLLRGLVGCTESWLALLGALLSTERGPADEACHAWLVQLIVSLRPSWEAAVLDDKEKEVEALEEAARQSCSGFSHVASGDASPGSLAQLLRETSQRSRAAKTAHRALRRRGDLAMELSHAAAEEARKLEHCTEAASAVATAAAERAANLDAEASGRRDATALLRTDLGKQVQDLRDQLQGLAPTTQQTQREIEEAETTQRELLRQVGQLSERLDELRRRRADCLQKEDKVRNEIHKLESNIVSRLSSEDESCQKTEAARALSATVVDLASTLSSHEPGEDKPQRSRILSLKARAENSKKLAEESAIMLGEQEIKRLQHVARVVDMCAEVAEERERSREAMEQLGVPSATLESDVVGEAEIVQSLHDALAELDSCRGDIEALCMSLQNGDVQHSASSASDTESSIATTLREHLETCEERRSRVAKLLADTQATQMPGYTEVTTIDDFLSSTTSPLMPSGSARSAQLATDENASTDAATQRKGPLRALLGFAGRAVGAIPDGLEPSPGAGDEHIDDDPFLLNGTELDYRAPGASQPSSGSTTVHMDMPSAPTHTNPPVRKQESPTDPDDVDTGNSNDTVGNVGASATQANEKSCIGDAQ